jgi:hypothetical protein
MGEAVRGSARDGGRRWRAAAGIVAALLLGAPAYGQSAENAERIELGRFTVVAYPSDVKLAQAVISAAARSDSFPGLPRPHKHVLIEIAPDRASFRAWVGPGAPEWGAAIAVPDEQRIVLQGRGAPSSAGDPLVALRHELAHLALHDFFDAGGQPVSVPRWFDEGYAVYATPDHGGGGGRENLLTANIALAMRGVPSLAALDTGLMGRETEADVSYALAYHAVADLAALDPERGLSLFFQYWRETGSLDQAVRRAYGIPVETFETQWRAQVRRRYGVLAVLSDLTVASLILLVMLLPLYIARVRRDRRRLAALRAADAQAEAQTAAEAERQAQRDAIEALLNSLR